MMPPGVQPEELNIKHVGKPRERVPELGVERRERPTDSLHRKTALNRPVFGDVFGIVINKEIAIIDPPEGDEGSSHQKNANE
jgi:hypothetical protein